MKFTDLEIWQLANELVSEIHEMTINDLPAFELYETGNQIRRSIKSVKSNIAEGFGRRSHKKDFLFFLTIAHSSNDETKDHLQTLFVTKSLKDEERYKYLLEKTDLLGKRIYSFIQAVKKNHRT
jgi:four helix bundle protein